MRIALRQRRIEPDMAKALIDAVVNAVAAQQLQRLRQGAAQAVARMQRGVGILKHHLHVAAQLAGKGLARRDVAARQRHFSLPVRI